MQHTSIPRVRRGRRGCKSEGAAAEPPAPAMLLSQNRPACRPTPLSQYKLARTTEIFSWSRLVLLPQSKTALNHTPTPPNHDYLRASEPTSKNTDH
eukprot:2009753-Rhodomonas_salina.2